MTLIDDTQPPADPDADDRAKRTRRGRRGSRAAGAAQLDAADAAQAEHGTVAWTGIVTVKGGGRVLLLTFGSGLALIDDADEPRWTYISGADIQWLDAKGRGTVTVGLTKGFEHVAPKGKLRLSCKDDDLFTVLMRIPRQERSTLPALAPIPEERPAAPALPQPSAARTDPAPDRRRHGNTGAWRNGCTGSLASAFAPTAYATHPDGVLRPCRWLGDRAPVVGSSIALNLTDDGWVASALVGGGR
jgi:hypothetical protein